MHLFLVCDLNLKKKKKKNNNKKTKKKKKKKKTAFGAIVNTFSKCVTLSFGLS